MYTYIRSYNVNIYIYIIYGICKRSNNNNILYTERIFGFCLHIFNIQFWRVTYAVRTNLLIFFLFNFNI